MFAQGSISPQPRVDVQSQQMAGVYPPRASGFKPPAKLAAHLCVWRSLTCLCLQRLDIAVSGWPVTSEVSKVESWGREGVVVLVAEMLPTSTRRVGGYSYTVR